MESKTLDGGLGERWSIEGLAIAQEKASGKIPVTTWKRVLHINLFGLFKWYAPERDTD